jgi:hypothetical protein
MKKKLSSLLLRTLYVMQLARNETQLSVVDTSVGRALSFSHEGPRFKSWRGHLFVL